MLILYFCNFIRKNEAKDTWEVNVFNNAINLECKFEFGINNNKSKLMI